MPISLTEIFCEGSAAIAEVIEHMDRAKRSFAKKKLIARRKKLNIKLSPRNEKSPEKNF